MLYKKVSKQGTVTLPAQIRHSLNIPKGAAVEVDTVDGAVVIKKHIPTCLSCGSAENVKVLNGIEMCSHCLEQFGEVEDNGTTATED